MAIKKSLNPLNQDDWKEFGKGFEADMDAILKDTQEKPPKVKVKRGNKQEASKIIDQNTRIRRKEGLSEEEEALRAYLDELMSGAAFADDISKEDIISAIKFLRNETLKRIKDDSAIVGVEDEKKKAENVLVDLAVKNSESKDKKKIGKTAAIKAIVIHLNGKKSPTEINKKREIELERDKNKSEIILTDSEKKIVLDFFDKDILPLYLAKRDENKWNGFNDEVEEFLKEQFFATAEMDPLFLDGDAKKIKKAWGVITWYIESKIKNLEDGSKKESQLETEKIEKIDWTLDEVRERLELFGADEDDINYFFSLHRKDRMDFLNSNDEDLAVRIEKLREKREADEARNLGSEKLDKDLNDKAREKKLIFLGDKLRNSRLLYLKKEYEVSKVSAKMKNFFNGIKNLSLGNVEEEVKILKDEYRQSVVAFSDAIVDIEGITDKEEQEIMLNYLGVSEALNLQRDKLIIKKGNDPKLLQLTEDVFGGVLKSYLKGYKSATSYLSKKGAELVGQKTDSKLLKFAGGLSGGMAFSIGLSNIFKTTGAPYWVTKSILLATSTAAMTMENKENMDKELGEQEAKDIEARKLAALKEMETKIQDELAQAMKNIFASEANTSLDYQENKEAINKKMWLKAFGKAAGKNLFFYSAGLGASQLIRDFTEFLVDAKEEGAFMSTGKTGEVAMDSKTITPMQKDVLSSGGEIEASGEEIKNRELSNIYGGQLHLKTNPTIMSVGGKEDIQETISRLGIKINSDDQLTKSVPLTDGASLDRAEILKEMGVRDLDFETKSTDIDSVKIEDTHNQELRIIPGKGIKDTLAKLLIEKHLELTEGKMGWDPEKYSSVEEWADKRAIGIVGELKTEHPDYNLDRVSRETSMIVDWSDKSDIRIAEIKDPYHLGGRVSITADNEDGSRNISAHDKEVSSVDMKKNILEEAEQMTKNEMKVVYLSGIPIEDYAKINNLTVGEFLENKSDSANKLREIVSNINRLEDDPTNTVSNMLKSINDNQVEQFLGDNQLKDFDYGNYLNGIIREELKLQLPILESLNDIKNENINVNNRIFNSFRAAVKNTIGFSEFEKGQTVREFLRESIKHTYEMGKIDDFRLALSRIKL